MAHLQKNINLSKMNTLGLQSQAELYLEVDSLQTFTEIHASPQYKSLPWHILGGGSNLVLPHQVQGLVLKISNVGKALKAEDADAFYVNGNAGENWHEFVQWTLSQGFYGLENLSLIPGTVGAAPIQNIGAYGLEVKDLIHEVECLNLETGKLQIFQNKDCRFSYRDSFFKQEGAGKYLVWSVTFKLPKKNQLRLEYGEIKKELATLGLTESAVNIAKAVISTRSKKLPDPKVIGNAGSFFKNPIVSKAKKDELLSQYPNLVSYPFEDGFKLAAGWLIDQTGWKGKQLGPVGMYEKQALVLVNHGGAEAADVWKLASRVISDVESKFGVTLEPEPVRW